MLRRSFPFSSRCSFTGLTDVLEQKDMVNDKIPEVPKLLNENLPALPKKLSGFSFILFSWIHPFRSLSGRPVSLFTFNL
ncbi:MAG: hypothetical protein V1775_16055 [Bacteroidota bacterium]